MLRPATVRGPLAMSVDFKVVSFADQLVSIYREPQPTASNRCGRTYGLPYFQQDPIVTTTTDPSATSAGPRAVDRLLAQYAEGHRNPRNEVIHFICVPAIVWSIVGLLWAVHPLAAIVATAASQLYYFRLSAPFAIGMLLMIVAFLASFSALPPGLVLPLAAGVFVVAWIGQFIGHKIEGKKPSFFDDLRFLLVGPLFVLGFLYRRFHVRY